MTAIPYCGPAPAPDGIHAAWNLDPVLLVALAASALFLRAESGRVKLGLAILIIAYVSPLCALSAGLFSARSIHHLLIVFGAAPLLATALRMRMPNLPTVFLLHVVAFWGWHVPEVYTWLLSSDVAYWLGQAGLLGSSLLLWRALNRRHTSAPAAFFVLVAMTMQMGLLGALITFAPEPLYSPHMLTTQPYGFTPHQDQQLAGLIMWVGSIPLSVIAGGTVLGRLLRRLEQKAPV